jgi:hypothetical protein
MVTERVDEQQRCQPLLGGMGCITCHSKSSSYLRSTVAPMASDIEALRRQRREVT